MLQSIKTDCCLCLLPCSSQSLLRGMDIGLVCLLKRGVPGSLLKKLWCPAFLGQGCKHGMAKNVRRDWNGSLGSESSKERVYVCIGQCLPSACSLPFDEEVIGFHFSSVGASNVGYDFVNESCRDIKRAGGVNGLDFGPVLPSPHDPEYECGSQATSTSSIQRESNSPMRAADL